MSAVYDEQRGEWIDAARRLEIAEHARRMERQQREQQHVLAERARDAKINEKFVLSMLPPADESRTRLAQLRKEEARLIADFEAVTARLAQYPEKEKQERKAWFQSNVRRPSAVNSPAQKLAEARRRDEKAQPNLQADLLALQDAIVEESSRRQNVAAKNVRRRLAELAAAVVEAVEAKAEVKRGELDNILAERSAAEGERDAFLSRVRRALPGVVDELD